MRRKADEPRKDREIKKMPKLTAMQLDTLTSFYYGEVLIKPAPYQKDGTRNGLWVMFDADGVAVHGRIISLHRRRLIKWVRWPSPDQEMVQAIILTPAGIKEMEAIDA
jgi:hypothetical protein